MDQNEQDSQQLADGLRGRLISASKALFLSKGLAGTSVDAIVASARTSKREFYKHFADREAVFLEIVEHSLLDPDAQLVSIRNVMAEDLDGREDEAESLKTFLFKAARFLYGAHLEPQSLGLFRTAIEAAILHPEVSGAVYEARTRSFLEGYFKEQLQQPDFQYDDPYLTAIRFGHLATDGFRSMIAGAFLSEIQQAALAKQTAELFIDGHASQELRDSRTIATWEEMAQPLCVAAGDAPILEFSGDTRLGHAVWNKVLDVAWEQFSACGYAKASLNFIAQQADVPRNTLYRRFGSKENLFVASAGRVVDQAFGSPLTIGQSGGTARDVLIAVALQLLRRFHEPANLALHRLLFIESARKPEITGAIHAYLMRKNEKTLRPVFAWLTSNGLILDEFAAEAPWRFYILATFGSRFMFVQANDGSQQERLAKEAVDLFLFGCRRPKVR
ncbi:TetR/AcrR family transcriptional regulator [Caenibius tardaugens]|uniref:TetR/AcrR family transcriptional regulator n=1 Tax=Caenibius tardaugens TaxID=169176 RepID=UPI0003F75780|nr:TetR/AcrR family transcriptional regulator [Caenibius tardaugens]